jgi:hypothetical protein
MTKAKYAAAVLVVGLATSGTAIAQPQSSAEARLKEMNITLPSPTRISPSGNRTGAVQIGNTLYLAGHATQFPIKGKVGKELSVEQGQEAARQSGLMILATARDALRQLGSGEARCKSDRLRQCCRGICSKSSSYRRILQPHD